MSEVQVNRGKLKPLIRRLKKTTGFHLQPLTLKRKLTKLSLSYRQFVEHLVFMSQKTTTIKRNKTGTIDRAREWRETRAAHNLMP
jgi:hypothetical protein